MSLVTDLRPVVNAGRQLAADLGLRSSSVTIRTRVWSGSKLGSGTATDTDVVITPPPKCSEPPARLVGDTVGSYEAGDIIVTKIARDTYAEADLLPPVDAGTEIIYLVTDLEAGDTRQYRIVGAPSNLNFGWTILLRRMSRKVS